MNEQSDGYDKVAQAIANGATAFWKAVFDDLGKRKASANLLDAKITGSDIDNFFKALGGAEMKIDLIPSIVKGCKTSYDSATVDPASGIQAKAIEGSISIGIGVRF